MGKTRVIVYIDGFNLYFGIRQKFGRKYLWLDIMKLASLFTLENDVIVDVKYFTSRVKPTSWDPKKHDRQSTYIDALKNSKVNLFFGEYQNTSVFCRNCGFQIKNCPKCKHNIEMFKEKKTDVNIAMEMINDSYENKCDKSLLISGDRDLSPPIDYIKTRFSSHPVVVVFPPERTSKHLQKIAAANVKIKEKHLISCQFPESINTSSGYILSKPQKWC